MDEDFNIVHNEQYEINEDGAQNYYYYDARRRQVFDKAGIYYAMADCCENCGPNVGSYDAAMAVPPRSNVVQFVVLGDLDGDGIFDHEDPDKDNDGVCNKAEAVEGVCTAGPDAFPEEKSQWADSDGDGVGDNLDGCDVYFEADESPQTIAPEMPSLMILWNGQTPTLTESATTVTMMMITTDLQIF